MADMEFPRTAAANEEDRLFESALDGVLSTGKKDYPSYVGGFKIASGHDFPVCSPVDTSIIFGNFQEPEEGLSDRAVVVAKTAFAEWSVSEVSERTEIFDRVIDEIVRQRYRLAALVSLSVGMTREDSMGEVNRLLDVLVKACDDIERRAGTPTGVWAVLTSYNSPLAAPVGYACAAIIAGNTVVMIPSAEAPAPVYALYEIIENAGLPGGVLNLIVDRSIKADATMELANNTDVAGIVASGSEDKMEELMFLQADEELLFINEIKGMNPIFVHKPSSMKAAARTVIESAFSYAGQRLDSCSKVVILESEQKQFTDALMAEARTMNITDPTATDAFSGPVISERKMKGFLGLADDIRDNIIFGGKRVRGPLTENGFYVMPAIAMGLDDGDDLNNMDSACPILSIQTVGSVDDAIDVINCTEYGLCAGIITKDENLAQRFVDEIDADEVFINDPSMIIGAASKALVSNFME